MISVNMTMMTIKILSEVFHCPYYTKCLHLSSSIIALMRLKCAAGIGERSHGPISLLL